MEKGNNLKALYGKPTTQPVKRNIFKIIFQTIAYTTLGILVWFVGIPVAILLKNQKNPYANLLLIASIIGMVLFIIAAIYGWEFYRNNPYIISP